MLIQKANYFRRLDYKPAKVTTGISLPSSFWNNKTKKASGDYKYINKRLKDFEDYSIKIYNGMSKNGEKQIEPKALAEQIKLHISSKFKQAERIRNGKTPIAKSKITKFTLPAITIPEYYGNTEINGIPTRLQDYIQYKIDKYSNIGPFNSSITAPTIKIYRRLKSHLEHYHTATNIELNLLTINKNAVDEFLNYFIKKKKENGMEYSFSYMSWMKKEIKNFLNKAIADKIPLLIDFVAEKKDWAVKFPKKDDPYLSLEKLKQLREKDFLKITPAERSLVIDTIKENIIPEVLETTKNYFLLASSSGMRFSDLKRVKHLFKIDDNTWQFDYVSEKTNRRIKVPIRDQYIIDLYLKTYNCEFKLNIPEQIFNKAIKACCLLAGLTEKVNVSTLDIQTRKQISADIPLWKLVSSKTGRKSYASNEVREYLTPLSIIQLRTGHTTEKNLRNYIQLTDEEFYEIQNKQMEMMKQLQSFRKQV